MTKNMESNRRDAIRKYDKEHGIKSAKVYKVQKTRPNPAKVIV